MKKYLALLVCFSLILQTVVCTVTESKAEHKWEGYIAISSKQELNAIREDTAAKYYLTADIVFEETDFQSGGEFYNSGHGWEIIESFSGVLDGNGHTIEGLKIERQADQVGLVGINDGEIKDLTFTHANVKASCYKANSGCAGIVAGINNGTIETVAITDSYVSISDLSGDKGFREIGAVCGTSWGYIRSSAVKNTTVKNFSGASNVIAGGICGSQYRDDSEIVDCYVTGGEVTCQNTYGRASYDMTMWSYAGGIAGNNKGLIKRCYNTSPVSAIRCEYFGHWTNTGGISGTNRGIIEECFNLARVTSVSGGRKQMFGIAVDNGDIVDSYYLYGTATRGNGGAKDKIGKGEALTSEQMKRSVCWSGFEFTEDWVLDTGSEINYPQLRRNREAADSGIPMPDDKDYSGVPEGYIGIFDVEDLFSIRTNLSGKYILMKDIDMTEATAEKGVWNFANCGWKPLSDGSENGFLGELDGNGHTIKGLTIRGSLPYDYAGLFEINNGTIKNILFENANINHSNVENRCSGIVAGVNKGTIENVVLKNCVLKVTSGSSSMNQFVGGICGENAGRINKCAVRDCTIHNLTRTEKGTYCGGICGIQSAGQSEITNSYILDSEVKSYNGGSISGETGYSRMACAGGITGTNYGIVRKCYNTSNVLADRGDSFNAYAGGIAGLQYSSKQGNIYDCFNLGQITVKVEGAYELSGIAPYGKDIIACYSLEGVLKKGNKLCNESVVACGIFSEKDISRKDSYPEFDFNGVWVMDTFSGIPYPQICEFREVNVKTVELANSPDIVEFFQSDEINPIGGKLRVSYVENANTGIIDIEKYMLSGYDMKKLGKQTVTVLYDGKSCSYEINVKPVPVSSVSFEEREVEINIGKSQKLETVILPLTATDKTLDWKTSDESIVSVDTNGEVKAKALGKATISVCSTNGKRAECEVTVVSRATSVHLNVKELVLNKGETQNLIFEALPADTTDFFTWETSDAEIVDVNAKGKIVANGRGMAKITVTASSGVTDVCNVRVMVPASEIQVSEKAMTLLQEKTALVSAKLLPEDSTDDYVWSSANNEIATVTEDGMITAHKPGVVEITAMVANGVKDCVEVTVLPAYHVTGIQFKDSEIILERDEMRAFQTEIVPANYTDEISYSVENEDVAIIEEGKLKAKASGTTYVNVTSSNGVSAKCKVTVVVSAQSIAMNINDTVMSVGDRLKLSAELFPEDTTDTIVWSSGDENIAKVDETGEVLAVNAGECSIYAKSDSGKIAECKVCVIENRIINTLDDWNELSSIKGDAKYILNADINVRNVTLNLPEQSSLLLDLNGHTIEGTNTIINNSGKLIIDDTSVEKNGYIKTKITDSDIVIKYCVVNTGSLYIDGGNIQADVTVSGMPSSPWAVALRNAGYVHISGGNLKADSVSQAKSLGLNKAYGILNHEDGVVDMSGGDISVNTRTEAINMATQCTTFSYGIYNNTSNTVSISGGTINCSHKELAAGKENSIISAGLYNNSNGKILLSGGEVKVTSAEGPASLKGSLLGSVNGGDTNAISKGKIEVEKGKLTVDSTDSDNLLVVGIMNQNGGEILVGSDKTVSKEDICIISSSPNNKDYVITNESGKLDVCRGILQSGYGIVSNMDYEMGEDDGIITADDLRMETKGLLFIGKGNVILNDGSYKGLWNLLEEDDNGIVYVPRGYVMSNSTLHYIDDGELIPIKYRITYMLDGGINDALNPNVYDITTSKIELCSPSKVGYDFDGWYEDSGFIKKVTEITGAECKDKILYAKWKKVSSDNEYLYPSVTPSNNTTSVNLGNNTASVNIIPQISDKREIDIETPVYTPASVDGSTFTKPPKIKKVRVKKFRTNGINLHFSKVNGISAYEIKYSVNKKFKKAKSKITKRNNLNIKSLKKKKIYYVKVRAYKLYGGKKVYSKWSSVKKIKVGK